MRGRVSVLNSHDVNDIYIIKEFAAHVPNVYKSTIILRTVSVSADHYSKIHVNRPAYIKIVLFIKCSRKASYGTMT